MSVGLSETEQAVAQGDARQLIKQFCEMVPTYTPYRTEASASKR